MLPAVLNLNMEFTFRFYPFLPISSPTLGLRGAGKASWNEAFFQTPSASIASMRS
jgi:hypothetical protein